MAPTANLAAEPDKPSGASVAIIFFACFLSLSAPLMTHVLDGYRSFDAVEVWLAFGLVAAFAALYALAHRHFGELGQRMLETTLILLLADLYLQHRFAPALIGVTWFAIGLFVRAEPHRFMAAFGGAALLTSIFTGLAERKPWISEVADHTAKASPGTSTGPAIVHIILDEHIGLAGLPQTSKGQETAGALQKAYLAHGFTTYSRAYSRHLHTINAVPDILNFGRRLGQSGNIAGGVVGPTDYLAGLRKSGYALTIYQADFLDLCSGADEKLCVTYQRGSLQTVSDAGLSAGDRLRLLMARFLGNSRILTISLDFYIDGNFGKWAENRPRPQSFKMLRDSWSIAGMSAMNRFVDDLKQARAGNVYFMHAMLPHYPYVVTRDCTMKPVSQWRRRSEWRSLPERQEAYYDQLHCSLRYIDRIAAALKQSPAGNNAIIVVHGDHGSRIVDIDATEENRGKIARDQAITSFSTLFAVRLPGQPPRNHTGFVAAPAVLQALVQNRFRTAPELPAETRPTVILDDESWKPTRPLALPTDW